MNRAQKKLAFNIFSIVFMTALFVFTMTHVKDFVIKREAMTAMKGLGREILAYRGRHGSLPSQGLVDSMVADVSGSVRLGHYEYRARWISFDDGPETILAYSRRKFSSFLLRNGYVVLTLNGGVHFWSNKHFEEVFKAQQSQAELSEMKKAMPTDPFVSIFPE